MLGSKKSNIYVSVTDGETQTIKSDAVDHMDVKPTGSWFISVEPHKHHFPGRSSKKPEPLHYSATQDTDSGNYLVRTHSVNSEPIILGNILVAENAKTSPDQIRELLNEKLVSGPSTVPSENNSEEEPDHWIRKALHILQAEGIIDKFDVGEFMTFAHGVRRDWYSEKANMLIIRQYAAKRSDNNAPAMVAYPRLNKDAEKKARSKHFWVDYPMAAKPPPRTSMIENDAKKYGGLM